MKKKELRKAVRVAELRAEDMTAAQRGAERRALNLRAHVHSLTAEVEAMRKHWRPVPLTHPWTPRDPQCRYCDEAKDAPRHDQ